MWMKEEVPLGYSGKGAKKERMMSGLNGMRAQRRHLLLDGVATALRDVDEVENSGTEVGKGRDGLHLNGVALFKRVVQDAGCVNHLNGKCQRFVGGNLRARSQSQW